MQLSNQSALLPILACGSMTPIRSIASWLRTIAGPLLAIAFGSSFLLAEIHRAAASTATEMTLEIPIEIPIYTQTNPRDLLEQAERLASETIARQFQQNPGRSALRVVVFGNRHGNILPILMIAVTRSQWQSNPRVNLWSQYYASGTLLQRPDPPVERPSPQIAARPLGGDRSLGGRNAAIDRARDSGQLTRSQAQEYLSDLD